MLGTLVKIGEQFAGWNKKTPTEAGV